MYYYNITRNSESPQTLYARVYTRYKKYWDFFFLYLYTWLYGEDREIMYDNFSNWVEYITVEKIEKSHGNRI